MKPPILHTLNVAFLAYIPLFAFAYIPSYSLILSQIAETQGKGAYRIEQTVLLETLPSPLKEVWWVEPQGLRVDVSGHNQQKGLYLRFIYKDSKKMFRDENKKRQTQAMSLYHTEWPFHLRKASKLKKLFALWQAGPFNIPERKEGKGTDPFVTLSRQGGVIQYKISHGKGQIYVEQDEFVIHGWKWPTGESLKASQFKGYPGNMLFPQKRLLLYGITQSAHITVQKVQSLKSNPSQLKLSTLKKSNHYPPNMASSDQDKIRNFYAKYR